MTGAPPLLPFEPIDPDAWRAVVGPPASPHPWETIRLADHPMNDVHAHLRRRGDDVIPLMSVMTEEGSILAVDLLSRPDDATMHPAAKTAAELAAMAPRDRPSGAAAAILNSGIGHEIAPGRTIRARIDRTAPACAVGPGMDTLADPGSDPDHAIQLPTGAPRIVAIGPRRIVEHPLEMAVAQRLGLDVALARRRALSTTSWPTWTNRWKPLLTGFRIVSSTSHEDGSETIRVMLEHAQGRRLSYSEGHVIVAGSDLPETIAMHAVGRPLSDILRIDGIDDLPLRIHHLHALNGGLSIDYAPTSECVETTG